jgi:hypothetical protein
MEQREDAATHTNRTGGMAAQHSMQELDVATNDRDRPRRVPACLTAQAFDAAFRHLQLTILDSHCTEQAQVKRRGFGVRYEPA